MFKPMIAKSKVYDYKNKFKECPVFFFFFSNIMFGYVLPIQ